MFHNVVLFSFTLRVEFIKLRGARRLLGRWAAFLLVKEKHISTFWSVWLYTYMSVTIGTLDDPEKEKESVGTWECWRHLSLWGN